MKVSVVIPMYNSASFIDKTLKCVLAQTFQDFEVIVVNDGSTDGSVDVVRAIGDARIRVVDKPNTGVSDTRNVGIGTARGEYIASLDSDDYWYPDHLSEAMAFFTEYPDIKWYGARQYSLPFGSKPPPRHKSRRRFAKRNFFVDGKQYIDSTSLIFKREIFEECGGYPVGVRYFEDWIFQGQIGAKHPIVGTNERITSVYYRGRAGSASASMPDDLCDAYRQCLHSLVQAVAGSHVKAPIWVYSRIRLFYRTALFKRTKTEMLSFIEEFSSFNGKLRTNRWRRFVNVAYMLSDTRMHHWLVVMVKKGLKNRLLDAIPIMRKCGVTCCGKWLIIVLLYMLRGVMDVIQDKLERNVYALVARSD